MTTFYSGTLQEGIALAMSEAKAVVCFARGWLSISPHREFQLPKSNRLQMMPSLVLPGRKITLLSQRYVASTNHTYYVLADRPNRLPKLFTRKQLPCASALGVRRLDS